MEELEMFFEAMKNKKNPVEVVSESLLRKKRFFKDKQKEEMLDEENCKQQLEILTKLTKICENIDELRHITK